MVNNKKIKFNNKQKKRFIWIIFAIVVLYILYCLWNNNKEYITLPGQSVTVTWTAPTTFKHKDSSGNAVQIPTSARNSLRYTVYLYNDGTETTAIKTQQNVNGTSHTFTGVSLNSNSPLSAKVSAYFEGYTSDSSYTVSSDVTFGFTPSGPTNITISQPAGSNGGGSSSGGGSSGGTKTIGSNCTSNSECVSTYCYTTSTHPDAQKVCQSSPQ